MKKTGLLLFYLSLISPFCCFAQYPPAPDKGKELLSYNIKELLVKDSLFLNSLDSLVFQKDCGSVINSKGGLFSMRINKNEYDPTVYSVILQFSGVFSMYESVLGYFAYREHIFFLYGILPQTIFCKSGKYKNFKIERDKIPVIQEYPIWEIEYKNGKYDLIFVDCW